MSWLLGSYINLLLLACKKAVAAYILYIAALLFLMAFQPNLLEFPRPTVRLSGNNYILSFSFPHVCVIYFSCLIWLARTSRTVYIIAVIFSILILTLDCIKKDSNVFSLGVIFIVLVCKILVIIIKRIIFSDLNLI